MGMGLWVEGQDIVWVDDEREPNRRDLEVSSSLREEQRWPIRASATSNLFRDFSLRRCRRHPFERVRRGDILTCHPAYMLIARWIVCPGGLAITVPHITAGSGAKAPLSLVITSDPPVALLQRERADCQARAV